MNGMPDFRPVPWWKWLIFWRIGLANIVAYVMIVGTVVAGWYYIDHSAKVTCERQNTGAGVIAGLVQTSRPYVPPETARKFDDAVAKLKPRRC